MIRVDDLTVLLPARNAESTVRRAVSSVLRALPEAGKVLALDDASDDRTGEVLADIARNDRRVGVITSDAPLGVAGALNRLINAAETALIARMDADDIALPWRFTRQLSALHRHGYDLVFSPVIMFGPSRFAIGPQAPVGTGPVASPYELLLDSAFIHPTLVGRRATVLGVGGYRSVLIEDWDLFMRLALDGARLARVATPTLLYRRHAGQVTASEKWKSAALVEAAPAQVHQELSQRLLGFGRASTYFALATPVADAEDVAAALELIDAVRAAAAEFPARERLSMRLTAAISARRIKRYYGADTHGAIGMNVSPIAESR